MTRRPATETNVWLPLIAGVIGAAAMFFGAVVMLNLPAYGIAL